MVNILNLPEDCLTHIWSLTSPRDVLRSSAVSKDFLLMSNSDTIWDTFLPSDCDDIISRSSSSIRNAQFASKKDLFLYLSHFPLSLENDTKIFGLDPRSGKIWYMLGARALDVTWGHEPQYWSWDSIPESRFAECAVLKAVCWLEITGRINTTMLSSGTTYGVYFVFKIKANTFRYTPLAVDFGDTPVKVSVSQVGVPASEIKCFYLKPWTNVDLGVPWRQRSPAPEDRPVVRDDGWLEIEMGRYRVTANDGGEGVVLDMALREIETNYWKHGLVVHSIDLRPLS